MASGVDAASSYVALTAASRAYRTGKRRTCMLSTSRSTGARISAVHMSPSNDSPDGRELAAVRASWASMSHPADCSRPGVARDCMTHSSGCRRLRALATPTPRDGECRPSSVMRPGGWLCPTGPTYRVAAAQIVQAVGDARKVQVKLVRIERRRQPKDGHREPRRREDRGAPVAGQASPGPNCRSEWRVRGGQAPAGARNVGPGMLQER